MIPPSWFIVLSVFLALARKVTSFEVNCGGPGIGSIVPDSPAFYGKTRGSVYKYAVGDFANNKYQTFSYAAGKADLVYSFNVYPGTAVNVTAEFSEIWTGAWYNNPRVMRLKIGGQIMKHHLNVYRDAGNTTNPLRFSREFVAKQGVIEIRLEAISGNAFISALDIQVVNAPKRTPPPSTPAGSKANSGNQNAKSTTKTKEIPVPKAGKKNAKSTTTTKENPAPNAGKKNAQSTTTTKEKSTSNTRTRFTSAFNLLRLNCGGRAIQRGNVLKDNVAFYANSPGYVGEYAQGDTHADIYTSQSYGDKGSDLVYTFKVTRGATVTVVARFAEIYAPTKAGDRLIAVYFNNELQMKDLDILVAAKGLNKHFDITRTFAATNGFVEVRVKAMKQNAMISGIDIKAGGLIEGPGKVKTSFGKEDDDDDDEDDKDDKKNGGSTNTNNGNSGSRTTPNTNNGNGGSGNKKNDASTNTNKKKVVTTKPSTGNTQTPSAPRKIPKASDKANKMLPNVITTYAEINCGGPAIGNNIYGDDMKYYKKSPGRIGMFMMGNNAASIYNSQSFGIDGSEIVYSMYVPAGSRVRVVAKFMEIWPGAASKGFRVMNLSIGGVVRAANLDVFTWAKGLRKELQLARVYTVTGTEVQVRVKSVTQNAMISGISLQVLPKTVEINCGGPAIGNILADSKIFNGKSPKGVGNFMTGDPSASVYNSQSYGIDRGDLVYYIPVPAQSKVRVICKFMEIWRGAASKGFRLMQLEIGGFVAARNMDVFTWAKGLRKGMNITREYTVTKPVVEVRIKSVRQNAMISGIIVEVLESGPVVSPNTNTNTNNNGGSNPNGATGTPNTNTSTNTNGDRESKTGEKGNNANKGKIIEAIPVTGGSGGSGGGGSGGSGGSAPGKKKDVTITPGKKNDVTVTPGKKKSVSVAPGKTKTAPAAPRPLVTVNKKIEIDCGGPAIGNILADGERFYFRSPGGVGMFATESPTKNVYHSQTYGLKRNDLVYAVSVPVGSKVKVVAKFAEIWEGAAKEGFRVFDVYIGGVAMQKNLDVWSAAGGVRIPYDLQRTYIVTGKAEVEVRLVSVKENAMLSGLTVEILSAEQDVMPTKREPVTAAIITKSLNLNCGGPEIAAKNLVADEGRFHLKTVDNYGTFSDDVLRKTTEYGSQAFAKNRTDLVYTLNVPSHSKVKVVAKFAEIWKNANKPGVRIIQVLIGGVLMADNLDVWKAAGGLNKEYDVQRTFLALNPEVEIRIKSLRENAMLSGIFVEVFEFHAIPVDKRPVAIPVENTQSTTFIF